VIFFAVKPLNLKTVIESSLCVILHPIVGLLYGMSHANTDRPWLAQNVLARVTQALWTTKFSEHSSPFTRWLPVTHGITYKLCLIDWKTFHTVQPLHVSELTAHYLGGGATGKAFGLARGNAA